MSIINEQHKHIFIHVPRCAGTSMENLPWVGGSGHASLKQFYDMGSDGKGHIFDKSYFKWAFVRNPYTRIISSFYRIVYANILMEESFDRTSFSAFIDSVTEDQVNRLWMLQPQHVVLTTPPEIDFDFIGRFENLYNDFTLVCYYLGTPNVLGHFSGSGCNDWEAHYNTVNRDKINSLYKEDFLRYDYQMIK